ncbi:hypothetical protein BDP27DRAFT_1428503 [Rhodocollybia butyracea]|uniref:Uncharacterized protein n=1 Tax=Rhodocollybia butyracea TaxID=206335 RepID=A0A9P5U0I0_9AGAR|nr:hypothetical protein BDP27DRAFT_1428503 [Rhodocollybia butyracea]
MSSSNTDSISNNETVTKVALSSDNAGANMHHVATLVKAFEDGAEMDASYEAIFRAVMENAKSRDALMKAMMDSTKLHVLFYLEITSDFKASEDLAPTRVVKKLTPPYGTKGFSNEVYQVGTDWILDVYAYRHANSNNVTVIVLHSGSTPATVTLASFSLWTTPETAHKFHYPTAYDSQLGDGEYSYHISYTHLINMIGPDGKNPIPVELIYDETIIAQRITFGTGSPTLTFEQGPASRILGMSVFNSSFEVGTSIFIGELSKFPGSVIFMSME